MTFSNQQIVVDRAEVVAQCAALMRRTQPSIFNQWPEGRLEEWLGFHWDQGACAVVGNGKEVVALAVAWRAHLPDIDDDWCVWDDTGDCLYFAQLHAVSTEALAACLNFLSIRVPKWQDLKLIAMRRRRRVRLTPELICRLWNRTKTHEC